MGLAFVPLRQPLGRPLAQYTLIRVGVRSTADSGKASHGSSQCVQVPQIYRSAISEQRLRGTRSTLALFCVR